MCCAIHTLGVSARQWLIYKCWINLTCWSASCTVAELKPTGIRLLRCTNPHHKHTATTTTLGKFTQDNCNPSKTKTSSHEATWMNSLCKFATNATATSYAPYAHKLHKRTRRLKLMPLLILGILHSWQQVLIKNQRQLVLYKENYHCGIVAGILAKGLTSILRLLTNAAPTNLKNSRGSTCM